MLIQVSSMSRHRLISTNCSESTVLPWVLSKFQSTTKVNHLNVINVCLFRFSFLLVYFSLSYLEQVNVLAAKTPIRPKSTSTMHRRATISLVPHQHQLLLPQQTSVMRVLSPTPIATLPSIQAMPHQTVATSLATVTNDRIKVTVPGALITDGGRMDLSAGNKLNHRRGKQLYSTNRIGKHSSLAIQRRI